MLCSIDKYSKSIIVMQKYNYYSFNVLLHRISWKILCLIWIGFYKNENNKKCYLYLLSKDLILHIIKFIGIQSNRNENDIKYVNKNGIFELENIRR